MLYTIKEQQEIVVKHYENPVDFIVDYTDLYSKQIKVPIKVNCSEIEYYRNYEQSLLDFVIQISLDDTSKKSDLFRIEEALVNFKKEMYYDKNFFHTTSLIYVKGTAILLDRVITEVNSYKYQNVDYLYFFTSQKLDLYENLVDFVVKSLKKNNNFNSQHNLSNKESKDNRSLYNFYLEEFKDDKIWKNIGFIWKSIDLLNLRLNGKKISYLSESEELKRRISIPHNFLGEKRVVNYKRADFLNVLLKKFKVLFEAFEKEEIYFLITTFCSEYSLREIGDEKDIACFKSFSDSLIL